MDIKNCKIWFGRDRAGKKPLYIYNDLNQYAFLITYLHEVAHLITYQKHKNKVAPHGKEWKNDFKIVLLPILNPQVFPDLLLKTLARQIAQAG